MNPRELQDRTKTFALRVLQLVRALPKDMAGQVVGRQIVRSGTSVAANYRAACRGRSRAEFVSKLGVVIEEADETLLWLEMVIDDKMLPAKRVEPLRHETHELVSIMVASRKSALTARRNLQSSI